MRITFRPQTKPTIDGATIPTPMIHDILTKLLAPFRGGGIRRRLLIWGLSLFGIALSIVVFVGYYYMVWQIRQDAAALQSELARVTERPDSQLCPAKDRAVFG